MADYVDLNEDQEWSAILSGDGWSRLSHPPLNNEVEDHIARCFGEPETILCETLSKFVQLDIHVIPPSAGRDFTTYVTSGMSDRPSQAPDGFADWARAELVMALPGSPRAHIDAAGGRHYLIDALRNYARRPHAMGTCFLLGDTIGTTEPDEEIGPDTRLSAYLLARPLLTPIVQASDAFRASLSTGEAVTFLALQPIHADELELKQQQGSEALVERLETAGVYELYDPDRPSVAMQKPKGFSLKRLFGG